MQRLVGNTREHALDEVEQIGAGVAMNRLRRDLRIVEQDVGEEGELERITVGFFENSIERPVFRQAPLLEKSDGFGPVKRRDSDCFREIAKVLVVLRQPG